MSGGLLAPARRQALAMVVIGVLAGFAAASAWNRLAPGPTPPEAPPAAASPEGHTAPG